MTGMLASVNSIAEALLVLDMGVDIIDLKQPEQGALGALDLSDVKHIVAELAGRCPVSATIGDLPMQPELVFNSVKAMAETGVDYIKIGFFPGNDWLGTLEKLSVLTRQHHALIGVLFADTPIDFAIISLLKSAGFKGVMLDTMNKKNGSLLQVMKMETITGFVEQAKNLDLLCGLAGSLRLEDISALLPSSVNYLGFRGALCQSGNRVGHIHQQAVMQIKLSIQSFE